VAVRVVVITDRTLAGGTDAIARRVDAMLRAGLIDEMRALLAREGFLPGSGTVEGREAQPPGPPLPQPRSEQRRVSKPS